MGLVTSTPYGQDNWSGSFRPLLPGHHAILWSRKLRWLFSSTSAWSPLCLILPNFYENRGGNFTFRWSGPSRTLNPNPVCSFKSAYCLPIYRKRPLVLRLAVWVSLFAYFAKYLYCTRTKTVSYFYICTNLSYKIILF
jgi:hypothetical protein